MDGLGPISLVPAAVTIAFAVLSRRLALSLFAGVVAGALAAGGLSPLPTLWALGGALAAPFRDLERLEIIGFILLVGGLLEVLAASGAFQALARALEPRLATPRKTRLAAWGLSMCLFFDDYANVLITGSSLRAVGRRRGLTPAMLAYTIDVVAVLASVMLISTWAAFEGGVMAETARALGRPTGAAALFLAALPYHLYTYLAILLTLVVALSGRWIGARLDTQAGTAVKEKPILGRGARARHVVVPLVVLLSTAILGLLVVGSTRVLLAGEPLSPMRVAEEAPMVLILITATLLALVLAALWLRRDGVMTPRTLLASFGRGVKEMLAIALIIVLATGLSTLAEQLGAGAYVARVLTQALPAVLLPCAVYTAAMLVTVATGFSWGSMAILMPVAYRIALAPGQTPALLGVMGAAVITGAVAGEHLIPYSEKAVLTSYACGIHPLYHFKTQLPQAALGFVAGATGFLLLGLGQSILVAFLLPAAGMVAVWGVASTKGACPATSSAGAGQAPPAAGVGG